MADNRGGLEAMIRSRRSPRHRADPPMDLEAREAVEDPLEEHSEDEDGGYRVGGIVHLVRNDPMSRFLRARLRSH